ncbi:MAG: hypothetical protein JHC31_05045 [Sulfurihydrogenibium sp.]|jgi:hypothetical protein|nr:hypothetical protein [Sulfurihydrogenibium sp.]
MKHIKRFKKYEFHKNLSPFSVYVYMHAYTKTNCFVFIDIYKHEDFRGHLVLEEGDFFKVARTFLKIVNKIARAKEFKELKNIEELKSPCLDLIH